MPTHESIRRSASMISKLNRSFEYKMKIANRFDCSSTAVQAGFNLQWIFRIIIIKKNPNRFSTKHQITPTEFWWLTCTDDVVLSFNCFSCTRNKDLQRFKQDLQTMINTIRILHWLNTKLRTISDFVVVLGIGSAMQELKASMRAPTRNRIRTDSDGQGVSAQEKQKTSAAGYQTGVSKKQGFYRTHNPLLVARPRMFAVYAHGQFSSCACQQ